MRAKALVLGMVLTLCVSADTPAADLGAINIQNNIETIGNNINVLNKDLNVTKFQKKTVKKKNKKKTKLSEIDKYKKKIFDMGVVDLSDSDDECAKIYKTKDKKSKVIGYLPDKGIMKVVEQDGKKYKIKSGKITGYVSVKDVVVDSDVETVLLDDNLIEAKFTKDVALKSEAKGKDVAVGMGYSGRSYPVIGFSNNKKYLRVQRTESITGWVPVSSVAIDIVAESAMTKSEYEDYKEEQELEYQAQLQSVINVGSFRGSDELTNSIISLLAQNESGNYMAARNGLAQFKGEKTITVGAWQWYGERAHNLLKRICATNVEEARDIINNSFTGSKKKQKKKADKLYSDILPGDSWENGARSFSEEELVAVKALLGSSFGIEVQKSQVQSDVAVRINVARSEYGLTNSRLIAYFCDLFWQNPKNARAITDECIKHYEGKAKFNNAKDALKYMHETAMKNSVMGQFTQRRTFTYSFCKTMSK